MVFASGIFAIALGLVHVFTNKIKILHGIPRSVWLSMAGGASVAYVFIHILPELSIGQKVLTRQTPFGFEDLSHHTYLISLIGLTIFYGLEKAAKMSRKSGEEVVDSKRAEVEVFWLHIIFFSIYNLLIGYLLVNKFEEAGLQLTLFFIAMALHFMVNDYGLLSHHKSSYLKKGRWIVAAAVLTGWAAGVIIEIPTTALILVFAFIAGGVIMNVLKEELPEERKSRFWAFCLGAAIYTVILLLAE